MEYMFKLVYLEEKKICNICAKEIKGRAVEGLNECNYKFYAHQECIEY